MDILILKMEENTQHFQHIMSYYFKIRDTNPSSVYLSIYPSFSTSLPIYLYLYLTKMLSIKMFFVKNHEKTPHCQLNYCMFYHKNFTSYWFFSIRWLQQHLVVFNFIQNNFVRLYCDSSHISVHFIFLFFCFFFKIILLLFNYSCLHFLPTPPPIASKPTSLPCFHPPPWLCPCVLYSSS